MPYYKSKPVLKPKFISNSITPGLVQKLVDKGYFSYKNDPLEVYKDFGCTSSKEDRFYKNRLGDEFYLAKSLCLFFSYPDKESKKFRDYYIVLVDNKIDFRYWDRDEKNGERNMFEHHEQIKDKKLIKKIEEYFNRILMKHDIAPHKSGKSESLIIRIKKYFKIKLNFGINDFYHNNEILSDSIDYNNILQLINILNPNPRENENQPLAKKMLDAYVDPKQYYQEYKESEDLLPPYQNYHEAVFLGSFLFEERNIIICLDWKCSKEDIAWAIMESSSGIVEVNLNGLDEDTQSDVLLDEASEQINKHYSNYALMFICISNDSNYYIFVSPQTKVAELISLGKLCKLDIGL